jgi:hypothetical protein
MPMAVKRAAAVPRDYYDQALCRPGITDVPSLAWIADPNQTYHLGTQRVKGSVLNDLALLVCQTCPVQWECASAAITAEEAAGVWADTLDNLRVLRRHPEALLRAKAQGVSVQVAVRSLVTGIS